MIVIGLMWHEYPSGNLGVGALTHSHFKVLDGIIKDMNILVEYIAISYVHENEIDFKQITPHPVHYMRLSIKDIISNPKSYFTLKSLISTCNIVLDLSAGDSFTDIYGFKRFIQQFFTKYIAISTKTPLILSPQTIGPFDKWYGRILSKFIFKRSLCIFARDCLSYDFLNNIKIKDNVKLSSDLAFVLPYSRDLFSHDKTYIHFGINVSGLLINGGYDNSNQFSLRISYPLFIRDLIKRFSCYEKVRIHLVSHVISDFYQIEDDYRACHQLSKEFPNCVLAPKFTNPYDAKSYISGLDFFSGARMHATIAAFSSGVPVVPVSYSRKFSGLFGSLGYDCLVDGKINTNEEALTIIQTAFENRHILSETIVRGNLLAQNRINEYRNYLIDALSKTTTN